MNPFFFGTSDRSLFGMYHPPKARHVSTTGVVLCYPFGQEYMRAHRAFRQLAMLLTRAGFHVFRFDYFGTGDSSGDSMEGSVDQWVADVGTAVEELKDTADVSRVALVGLRFGATLAALAAADRADVESVVLWDPVIKGGEYATDLAEEGVSHESYRAGRVPERNDGVVGVLGFPLTEKLRAGMNAIDLNKATLPSRTKVLIVVSGESDESKELERSFSERSKGVEYRCIPTEGNWNEVDANGSALIPQAVIQGIVQYLAPAGR